MSPMGMKLLIFHSDDLFRSRLAERMRSENHKVFESSLEAEAIEVIQQEDLDVILLGVFGPNINRLSLLKTMRRIKPYTEVILLTNSEEHSFEAAIKAMQLGAFDDLRIPIDIQALICRIKDAYKRKKERLKNQRMGYY